MQTLFNWLSSPAFKALGMSLLSSLWQAAIVFALVYALILLNKNGTARIKYNLAAIGSLVITIWFIQTFIYYLDRESSMTQTLKEQSAALFYFPGNFPVLSSIYPEPGVGGSFRVSRCIPLALIIYFIGVAILLSRVLYSYLQTNRLKTQGLLEAPAHLIGHLIEATRTFHIASKVQLFLSDKINTPLMMGYLRPIILLPISITTHLSTAQIQAIITHELAHVRRQDYLINLIGSIVEALFFFNPFIWLLSKIMREQREKACDELVVKSVPAYTYATALLALEKINETKLLALAANGHNSFKLLNRIKLFTMKKNPIISVKQKIVSLLLIVMAIGCIAWLSPKQPKTKDEQKSTVKVVQQPDQAKSLASSDKADSKLTQKTATVPSKHKSSVLSDTLSPEIQKQVDEIAKSAGEIAASFAKDTAWQSSLKAIQQKAMLMAGKFQQDPAFKASIEKITTDAKALSGKMKEDPALKKQLQDLEISARKMAGSFQPSAEMQQQLAELSARSASMASSFQKDTAWKKQLSHIRIRAEKIAAQLKDNPEMQAKIKKMADTYKELALKVLNDPKFKNQLQQLRSDLGSLNWDFKDHQ